MRTIEEIIKLLNIKTKSKDLKKVLYDKLIKKNIDYDILIQYPELILLFKNSNKIDLNKLYWYHISINQKLSESFIREFKDKVYWSSISEYQNLSESFITEHKDKVWWDRISCFQKLSESFISEHKDKVSWYDISQYQKLSESFISEHKDKVKWYHISEFQKLSESFISEHKDNFNWYYISEYQKLSESFIREFKDKVSWYYISEYQKLSESFIREFKDKVSWYNISKYQKLTESFITEHKDKLKLNDDSWLYKDGDFKLEAIKKTGLYTTDDNYVYGFKGIRSNRYSRYNYQYQYLKGKTYECHADFNNDNRNSFGLSVWTKEEATNYCNELVVEVKIHKDDLSALVHKGGKIRCQKFTILS
jgi:hypothetical protein